MTDAGVAVFRCLVDHSISLPTRRDKIPADDARAAASTTQIKSIKSNICLSSSFFFVRNALVMEPRSKLGVFLVVLRNYAMFVFLFVRN